MANQTIRARAREHGVFLWQIAEALGITDSTFSRWMRRELPEGKKQEIFEIIDDLGGGG